MINATTKKIKSLHSAMINYLISLFGCFRAEDVEPPVVFKDSTKENELADWVQETENQEYSDTEDWDVLK